METFDALPGSPGEHLLQERLHTEQRAQQFYARQVLDHLNPAMAEFAGDRDLMFVATADAAGACDVSLRTGPAGFVIVLAPRMVAYPEYRGNGVMASMGNISENPHIGIMLVDFADDQVGLHVNGRAQLVDDRDLRAQFAGLPRARLRGQVPVLWVKVHVEEAYIHCSRHIPRLIPARRGRAGKCQRGGAYFATVPLGH